jgi:hypothetical protein
MADNALHHLDELEDIIAHLREINKLGIIENRKLGIAARRVREVKYILMAQLDKSGEYVKSRVKVLPDVTPKGAQLDAYGEMFDAVDPIVLLITGRRAHTKKVTSGGNYD